ncbi:anti-sigma factor family protein [Sunxiuqinia rutila]|uniref:anti-sigma factor family protein n=1 Tax=Sunxiuqinia rutila TaxID=1397841 RepID=UPI003D35FDF8
MKHRATKEKLLFFLEDTLSAPEKQKVAEHLSGCVECRQLLEELRQDWMLLKLDKYKENDPYFYTRLKARMEKPVTSVARRVWQPALFGVLLVLAVSLGTLVGKQFSAEPAADVRFTSELVSFDGLQEEPIEQFLLTFE